MSEIYDLIYAGEYRQEVETKIQAAYPEAVLEDASDFVHEGRFSVEMEVDEEEWLLFLFTSGIFSLSFISELTRGDKPELYMRLMRKAVELKESESA